MMDAKLTHLIICPPTLGLQNQIGKTANQKSSFALSTPPDLLREAMMLLLAILGHRVLVSEMRRMPAPTVRIVEDTLRAMFSPAQSPSSELRRGLTTAMPPVRTAGAIVPRRQQSVHAHLIEYLFRRRPALARRCMTTTQGRPFLPRCRFLTDPPATP